MAFVVVFVNSIATAWRARTHSLMLFPLLRLFCSRIALLSGQITLFCVHIFVFHSLFAHKVTGKERAFCSHFSAINIFTQRILLPLNPPGSNSKKYKPTKKAYIFA
jgi:hypothetical protein